MATLTILRGISGSGKSTWTAENMGDAVVLNRDSLRVSLFGSCGQDYYASEMLSSNENIVTAVSDSALRNAATWHRDVISDNTNVSDKVVNEQIELAKYRKYNVCIIEFRCTVAEAILSVQARAAAGGLSIPDHVIRRQHAALVNTKIKPHQVVDTVNWL